MKMKMDIDEIRNRKNVLDISLKNLSKKMKDFVISVKVCKELGMEYSVFVNENNENKLKKMTDEYNDKFNEREELRRKERSLVNSCKHVWKIYDRDWYYDENDNKVTREVYVCEKCGEIMLVLVEDCE